MSIKKKIFNVLNFFFSVTVDINYLTKCLIKKNLINQMLKMLFKTSIYQ